jgi:hypothetical protein
MTDVREGFMREHESERATDVVFEAVNATAMHLRRIVGFVSTALGRAAQEVADLVWDYQNLAGDLRQFVPSRNGLHDADPTDLRWPATGYRGEAAPRYPLPESGSFDVRERLN